MAIVKWLIRWRLVQTNALARTLLKRLAYAYVLRFPLLTAAAMVGLVVGANSFARSLLGNLFDINWPIGMLLLSFTAFCAAWTIMTTWRLTLLRGPARFHLDTFCVPYRADEDVKWWHLVVSGLLGLSVVVYALLYTKGHNPPDPAHHLGGMNMPLMIFMAFMGLLASLLLLWVATLVQDRLTSYGTACSPAPSVAMANAAVQGGVAGAAARVRSSPNLLLPATFFPKGLLDSLSRRPAPLTFQELTRGLPNDLLREDIWRGYFKYNDAGLPVCVLRGHALAAALFFLTLAFYAAVGVLKFIRLGEDPYLPTLGYVMLLLTLLCWGLAGAAFFLDRFRIPVMLPLLVLFIVTALPPWSDHYYPVVAGAVARRQARCGDAAQPAPGHTPLDGPVIVVAANGGGIQAGAWAAVVLTELQRKFGDAFGTKVRVVSSVSGGSVGAMYFVNEYSGAGSPPSGDELDGIVERVEGSSLDEIAWGLTYPDLLRSVTSYGSSWDRGRALEYAWLRRDLGGKWKNREGIEDGLSKWQTEVAAGHRPGSIFNTTVSDTGQRLPLSTVDLPPCSEGKQTQDKLFAGLGGNDIPVMTAARLSASFPYVSPAARANFGGTLTGQPHIVDGGYYDNYGISSLVEWMDYELPRPDNQISRVLVVEIRGSRTGGDYTFEKQRGWLYQSFAPIGTLLHVRDTGQFSHNRVELQLLIDKWTGKSNVRSVPITDVVFEYDGADPPLSWHLNRLEKQDLKSSWARVADNPTAQKSTTEKGKGGLTIVGDFLSQP